MKKIRRLQQLPTPADVVKLPEPCPTEQTKKTTSSGNLSVRISVRLVSRAPQVASVPKPHNPELDFLRHPSPDQVALVQLWGREVQAAKDNYLGGLDLEERRLVLHF